MTRSRTWLAVAAVPVVALSLLASLGSILPSDARASVPTGPPVFSNPLVFTNAYSPFAVGGTRVFTGKEAGARSAIVDEFLADTRTFSWNGGTVTCRVLREINFEDGALVEDTTNYFAQADDGTVYYFGEVVNDYEAGAIVGHGGSWLVGGPSGGDPPETLASPDPGLFMPANPEEGDQFLSENVPTGPQELDQVRRTGRRVKVTAGSYEGCIEVLETNPVDGSTETKWYAPGVGVIRGKARGEGFGLVATSFVGGGN